MTFKSWHFIPFASFFPLQIPSTSHFRPIDPWMWMPSIFLAKKLVLFTQFFSFCSWKKQTSKTRKQTSWKIRRIRERANRAAWRDSFSNSEKPSEQDDQTREWTSIIAKCEQSNLELNYKESLIAITLSNDPSFVRTLLPSQFKSITVGKRNAISKLNYPRRSWCQI